MTCSRGARPRWRGLLYSTRKNKIAVLSRPIPTKSSTQTDATVRYYITIIPGSKKELRPASLDTYFTPSPSCTADDILRSAANVSW